MTYYLVVYLMACKLYTPITAGVGLLPFGLAVVPVSGITGPLITRFKTYRWAIWVGWILTLTGSGLLILVGVKTSPAAWIFIFICAGAGHGFLLLSQSVAVQSTCQGKDADSAVCMYSFMRSFGLCLGVILGGTAFQNFLRTRLSDTGLPTDVASNIEGFIPILRAMTDSTPAKMGFQKAYEWALQRLFVSTTAVAALGGLLSLQIRDYPIVTPVRPSRSRSIRDSRDQP